MPNSKQTLSHIDFESNFDKLVTQRVKGIWKTLQEASDNLYTCDQFLGDYNQLNHNRSMKDSCTQTDNSDSVVQLMCHLCEKLMNSVNDKEIITGDLLYSPQLMSKVEGSKQSRDSERHVSKFSEELSYSVFEQTELQNVIHQELKILKSLVQNLDEEVTSKDDLKYRIVKLLSYCEKISNIKENHNNYFSAETDELMNSIENSARKFDDLLQQLSKEKERREKAEALLDEAQLKLDSLEAGYKMISEKGHDWSHLHARVIELAERVAEEHFKVMQLQKSRSLLLGHIRILRCCLSHDKVTNGRVLHQLQSQFSREQLCNIRERNKLKFQVSSTRRRYQRHLSSSQKRLRSSHRIIRHLKHTTRKMKNLCTTLERRYQVIIFELGQEIRSIAQMLSPFNLPQLLPIQPNLSASEIGKWFTGIQHLSHQIQNYIVHKLSNYILEFQPEFSDSYVSLEDINIVKNIIDTSLMAVTHTDNSEALKSRSVLWDAISKHENLQTSTPSLSIKVKISNENKTVAGGTNRSKDINHGVSLKNIDESYSQNIDIKNTSDCSVIKNLSLNNTSDISFELDETTGSPFSHELKSESKIVKGNLNSEEQLDMVHKCKRNFTTQQNKDIQDENHGSHLTARLIKIMDDLKHRLVQQHLYTHPGGSPH